MRILVTLPWGERLGGAEAMLQMVLDGVRETDHEIELVFLEAGPWPTELSEAGFHVEIVPAGRLRDAHRLLATVARLARLFRRRRPDLILNWMPKTHLYGSPAAVLAGMRDRVLWWQHGIPAGHWMDRCATILPAVAVGCSSGAAARAQAETFPSRATFVVWPGTGMPAADTAPTPARPEHGIPVIGIVGRLQPWKGQDRLLEAQALLRERGREVRMLIVGGDAYGLSSDYAASLPSLVEELGLADVVTMTGQVQDAGPYIGEMDILVNASEKEPFGIVLLEGMARGVAVLAVGSGGPAEILVDGETGVLARSGAPADLADALERLLASPELRRGIAERGRERFLADFTDVAMRRRFFHELEALASR
jgi:glycosyltransferase involved in cell wall biosynthesis